MSLDGPSDLSDAVGRATPATRLRWFAAAHTVRWEMATGGPPGRLVSTVHAKQMGSTVTACGMSTVSWPKLFGIRFPLARADTCRVCAAKVVALD